MAAIQAAAPSTEFTFFGTCPTGWDNLTPIQKESCVGTQLIRQIEGYFAWAAAGPLLEQWNARGEEEYSAVIAHGKARRFRSSRQQKIPGHELRLLSLVPAKETAAPFVIITSKDKDDRAAKDTIERLKQHPRLARFSLKYVIRRGNTRLTMASLTDASPNQAELNINGEGSISGSRGSVDAFTWPNAMKGNTNSSRQSVGDQETQQRPENLCGDTVRFEDELGGTLSPLTTPMDNGAAPAPELSTRGGVGSRRVDPVPSLTIAEARKAIDRERKPSLFSRSKPKWSDEILSKYIRNRDLVSFSLKAVLSCSFCSETFMLSDYCL